MGIYLEMVGIEQGRSEIIYDEKLLMRKSHFYVAFSLRVLKTELHILLVMNNCPVGIKQFIR